MSESASAPAAAPLLMVGERRRLIAERVAREERVTVEQLSTQFATSHVTIRSDLNALAEAGVLVRTHGGAMALRDGDDLPLDVKANLHPREKLRIAAAAAAMVQDGETLILDSGTTTGEIARQLAQRKLTRINVITNALNVAMLLAPCAHVHLIMLGGVLQPMSYTLTGPQAEGALAGLQADRLFLGVDSLDPDIGVMTPHLMEAQLNARMIDVAHQVVAVADSSKLMRRNLSVIARLERIHVLITDTQADAAIVEAIEQRGTRVMRV